MKHIAFVAVLSFSANVLSTLGLKTFFQTKNMSVESANLSTLGQVNLHDLVADMEDLPFTFDLDPVQLLNMTYSARRNASQTNARSKPFIWWHVEKVAGSWFCAMANLAGDRVVQPNLNCGWTNHDDTFSTGMSAVRGVTCPQRTSYFKSHTFTWGAIEREPWDGDICPMTFEYGTMLRDPMNLMKSALNFHQTGRQFFEDCRYKRITYPYAASNPHWNRFDNFQVRIFGNAVNVPAGQIGPQHLLNAKRFLKHFKYVGILETMATNINFMLAEVGWPQHIGRHVHQKRNPTRYSKTFTPEELRWLKQANKMDYKLYNWVKNGMKG